MLETTEVELTICVLDLFRRDADILQSLDRGGVVQHLLQEQKLSAVVVAEKHLVIAERLAQRMGRHLDIEIQILGDALEDSLDGVNADRLIDAAAVVGDTAEHIVAQAHAWGVLQIESDRFDDCGVDRDVAVLFTLARVARLLLEDREAVPEGAVLINNIGEAQHPQIACAESKVNAHDKEHVVSVPAIADKVLGDGEDVVHALDRLCRVIRCQFRCGVLLRRCDQASRQLASRAGSQCIDVDDVAGACGLRDNWRHIINPFISRKSNFLTYLEDNPRTF